MKPILHKKLILASKSPRRRDLLEQMGITIRIQPSNVDESGVQAKTPAELVEKLAILKARDIASRNTDDWVLGADTVVAMENHVLGKPDTPDDACRMLTQLSSRNHQVYTGYCLANHRLDQEICRSIQTQVWFKSLSEREIQWYVKTGEAMDKAGAYGIQGIGAFLVKKISGSYSNVVGLPVCEVFEDLTALKIIKLDK